MLSRQKFAMILGIVILMTHIIFSFYVWFYLSPNPDIKIREISLPLTVTYAIAIIKWFIDTQGIITSDAKIGTPYAFVIIFITGSLLISLPVGLHIYENNTSITEEKINSFYIFIESSIGALFSLLFADLFGEKKDSN